MPSLLSPSHSVIWHNPDSRFYVEGCGLVHLHDASWLAVVPVVPRHTDPLKAQRHVLSLTHLVRSDDDGTTWHQVAELPYYSAVPFLHDGDLYLFAFTGGIEFRNDDLLLLRSLDEGATWSAPTTLCQGHFWNCHTGMTIRDNRLYWAIDDISYGMNGVGSRGPRIVCGDLSQDLLRPEAWRFSNTVPFPGVPDAFCLPRYKDRGGQYLEPNVIQVNGQIRILAVVKVAAQSTTGFCGVLDAIDDGEILSLAFTQYHPMPGGQLKFGIVRDPVSGLFWATVSLPVDGQGALEWSQANQDWSCTGGNDRRFLMLMYGLDGLNWFPAGCIARASRLSQSFMYAMPVIAGDDLGIISRTSIAAPNRHDADHATFHRVPNFRSLAMTLTPDA